MGCCTSRSEKLSHGGPADPSETETSAQDTIVRQTNQFKENIRTPTDVIFLIIFVLLVVFTAGVGAYAYVMGHPERLISGIDSEGRVCGFDEAVRDKPFLYYFDLTTCAQLWRLYNPATGINLQDVFSCPTPQVCVSECPRSYDIAIRTSGLPICTEAVDTSVYSVLLNQTLPTSFFDIVSQFPIVQNLTNNVLNKMCAPYYIASIGLGGRCIPSLIQGQNIIDNFVNLSNQSITDYPLDITTISISDITDGTLGLALVVNLRQFVVDVLGDFNIAWPGIVITVVCSAILGFLIIFLMRFLLWIIVPAAIILCVVSIGAVTGFSYYQYALFSKGLNASDPISAGLDQLFMQNLRGFQYQKETWLAIAIIGTVVWLVLVLFICCLIPNLIQVIRVIGAASKAIWGVPESFFLPFLSWLLLAILFALWASSSVFLATTNNLNYKIIISSNLTIAERTFTDLRGLSFVYSNGASCNINEFNTLHNVTGGMLVIRNTTAAGSISDPFISCQFSDFNTHPFVIALEFFLLFMFLWLTNYVIALTQCTLAGGFSFWYFIHYKLGKPILCKCSLLRGFLKAFIFHTGSLALGSLVIAIIQFVEFVLVFIQHRLQAYSDRLKLIKWILRALTCVVFCVEKFLRYVNRVVYIEIAIYGTGFCVSLCKSIKLFVGSPVKFAVKDTLAILTLFLVRVAIISLTALIAYFIISYNSPVTNFLYQGRLLTYSLIPLIFLVLISYVISSAFVSVYSMAIDTIFICTLEDKSGDIGKEFEVIRKNRELKVDEVTKVDSENVEGASGEGVKEKAGKNKN